MIKRPTRASQQFLKRFEILNFMQEIRNSEDLEKIKWRSLVGVVIREESPAEEVLIFGDIRKGVGYFETIQEAINTDEEQFMEVIYDVTEEGISVKYATMIDPKFAIHNIYKNNFEQARKNG